MNNSISASEFKAAIDRCLSDIKTDPGLARRVMAAEKGKPLARKTPSVRFVCALAVLLLLASAACAAGLYRAVTWKGAIRESVEPVQTPKQSAEATQTGWTMDDALRSFIADVPEEQTAFVWYENERHEIQNSELHKKKKTFSSHEAFLRYMADARQLTVPARLPEGEVAYYSAEVSMDCAASGAYERLESNRKGPLQYSRFRIDEDAAVATGYSLVIGMQDGRSFHIQSELRSALSEEALLLRDGETARSIAIPGMADALLIQSEDPAYPDGLLMRRTLDEPVQWKLLPLNDHMQSDDDNFFREEYVTVWAHSVESEGELLRLFSAP